MPRSSSYTPTNKKKQDNTENTKKILAPRVTAPRAPPPPKISTPPSTNSYGSGFVDSLVSGFGFGVGNSLAKKVFEPTINPSETQKITVPPVSQPIQKNLSTTSSSESDDIFNKYMECLQRNEPTENCEIILNGRLQ